MKTMKKINIKPADKVANIDKYIFDTLDEWKNEARARGIDLIDLGIGNPDSPTPQPVVDAAVKAIQNPANHGYPNFQGKPELKVAIKEWMQKRYDVKIDSDYDIQILSGGKEGLADVALAFTNPGDTNLIPDPYYPVMSRGTWISGGEAFYMPLRAENDFLPDLDAIPKDVAKKAKILIINYPNNPTSALAPKWFLEKVVNFCIENEILLVSDLAYGEVCYEDYRPLSIFSIEGAKDIAVEVHTFSKTFNMAGWRIGFVLGKKEFIDPIHAMKTNFDYGTSNIIQDAAIAALQMPYEHVENTMKKYQERRDFMISELKKLGWDVKKTQATMYLWLKTPKGMKSKEFCDIVMEKTGVVFTPGMAFGKQSEGYFRLSLVQKIEKLKEAVERLKAADIKYEE